MIFDEDFLKSLPDDWPSAIDKIHDRFMERAKEESLKDPTFGISVEGVGYLFEDIEELHTLLGVFKKKHGISRTIPNITAGRIVATRNLLAYMKTLREEGQSVIASRNRKQELGHYKHVFETALNNAFSYEFSQGDLDEIQALLNQLRDLIADTSELEEGHRHRLLRRLEKLQSEMHKVVSDLDRFWGFFIDASIVVGLMGENAKPMVDVIQKIVKIIWPTQTRAYELPSDFPFKLLDQGEDDKS